MQMIQSSLSSSCPSFLVPRYCRNRPFLVIRASLVSESSISSVQSIIANRNSSNSGAETESEISCNAAKYTTRRLNVDRNFSSSLLSSSTYLAGQVSWHSSFEVYSLCLARYVRIFSEKSFAIATSSERLSPYAIAMVFSSSLTANIPFKSIIKPRIGRVQCACSRASRKACLSFIKSEVSSETAPTSSTAATSATALIAAFVVL